jgi:hypothetical protein
MTPADAVRFRQEQSLLMWSRVRTASAIEAGAVIGAYKTWVDGHSLVASAVLVAAAVLLGAVAALMNRDAQYMSAAEAIAGDHLPHPPRPWFGLSGRQLAIRLTLGLAGLNLLLIPFVWLYSTQTAGHGQQHVGSIGKLIEIAGLSINLIGALVVLSATPKLFEGLGTYDGPTDADYRRSKRQTALGVGLIVVGFAVQIVGVSIA